MGNYFYANKVLENDRKKNRLEEYLNYLSIEMTQKRLRKEIIVDLLISIYNFKDDFQIEVFEENSLSPNKFPVEN